jgi:hypothetical protein
VVRLHGPSASDCSTRPSARALERFTGLLLASTKAVPTSTDNIYTDAVSFSRPRVRRFSRRHHHLRSPPCPGQGERYDDHPGELARDEAGVDDAVFAITIVDARVACLVLRPAFTAAGCLGGRVSTEVESRQARKVEAPPPRRTSSWRRGMGRRCSSRSRSPPGRTGALAAISELTGRASA